MDINQLEIGSSFKLSNIETETLKLKDIDRLIANVDRIEESQIDDLRSLAIDPNEIPPKSSRSYKELPKDRANSNQQEIKIDSNNGVILLQEMITKYKNENANLDNMIRNLKIENFELKS